MSPTKLVKDMKEKFKQIFTGFQTAYGQYQK